MRALPLLFAVAAAAVAQDFDGRNPSTFYVDMAGHSEFLRPAGFREQKVVVGIDAGINLAVAAARPDGQADKLNDVETTSPISAENAHQLHSVKEVPKRADLIISGPQRGELTLLNLYNTVEVVDEANLQTLRTIVKDHQPSDLAASPDWKLMTWTEPRGSTYIVEETVGGRTIKIEVGDNGGGAAFSPDGKLLAIGHTVWSPNVEGAGDSETKLFDTSGKLLRTFKQSGPGYVRPVFSPDGKTLAIGSVNVEAQLFDVATGRDLHTLNKRGTREIAFSPDGKTLAASYVDGTIALWDVDSGMSLHLMPSGCGQVYSVAWSPKGDVLASAGTDGRIGRTRATKGMIDLWEPGTMKKLRELELQKHVYQVRFTADGTRLISSSAAGDTAGSEWKITLWALPGEVDP